MTQEISLTERKKVDALEVDRRIKSKLFSFNAGKELAWAWNANENVILFGPGGYGKSDAAVLFNDYLYEQGFVKSKQPFVMAFGQGMTEERLLGGLDVKEFQSEGKIKYLLEEAFINHEVVVFEELWDAFPAVLLILKDILQSKSVRTGNEIIPIKTKIVIACTNRSRAEVVSDNSTEALMQRFQFEKEVKWTSWEMSDYRSAFECATGLPCDELSIAVARACAESSKSETKISPRTAGKALKSAIINGLESLEGMFGFDKSIKQILKERSAMRQDKEQADLIKTYLNDSSQLLNQLDTMRSGIKTAIVAKRIHLKLHFVSNIPRRDANVALFENTIKQMIASRNIAWEKARELIINPKRGSLAEKIKMSSVDRFQYDLINITP